MVQGYSNFTLTDDEIDQVTNDLEEAYLDNLVMAQVLGMTPVDPGTLVITRNRVVNMGGAIKIAEGSTFPKDAITRVPEHTYIDKIGLAIELTMEEVNAGRMSGVPIDDMNLRSQARQVAEFTEENCISVLKDVAVAGGVGAWAAGTDSDSGKHWNETGATPYEDICKIVEAFEENNSGTPDVMLFGANLGGYFRHKDSIDGVRLGDDISGLGITLVKCPGMESGHSLLINSENCTLKAAIPFSLDGPHWKYSNQVWEWIAFTRVVPDVVSYRDLYYCDFLS